MQDEEVGKLWRICRERGQTHVIALIRKLVKERAVSMRMTVNALGGNTYRVYRFREGKKEPNPYYNYTEVDWERKARESFGILDKDWK